MSETLLGDIIRLGGVDYIKISELGAGGYASVASFWELAGGPPVASRLVAIKCPYYQGRAVAKLEAEMLTLIKLNCEAKRKPVPTITLLSSEMYDGDLLILMDHAAGCLADYCDQDMTASDVKYLANQILKKLDIMHKVGKFIHHDIKPDNILIGFISDEEKLKHAMHLIIQTLQVPRLSTAAKNRLLKLESTMRAHGLIPREVTLDRVGTRQAYLGDIGLSSPISQVSIMQTGTLGYMPVESLAGGTMSHKIDIFGFGVTIVELVLGKPLMKIVGSSLKVKSLNLLHQLVNLKGPMTAGLVASLRERNDFFVGGTLRESVNAPQTPKIEDLLLLRCTELLWSADDIRRITTVASMCLRHSYTHRSPISTLLKKLEEEYVE